MGLDLRAEAARFYDQNPDLPDDVPFYVDLIGSEQATVLELGCGTGRVTLPLTQHCDYIHGIDLSPAMISICRRKLAEAGIPPGKARVEVGDITDFDLGRTFDLIIAPFRVLQNLETDTEVDGLFRCMPKHLAPGGTCILNVFNPDWDAETMRREWCTDVEALAWEMPIEGGKLACYERRPRMDKKNLVLYPELIYRRYEGEILQEEAVLKLVMRCYYPDEFEKLIITRGFDIFDRWGGYQGEPYGEGSELVIQFAERA